MSLLETGLLAFSTLFATIGPIETAILFVALTPRMDARHRRNIAIKATVIATVILVFFTLVGGPMLHQLGVTLPALHAAGGVLLMIIAIDMIFLPDSNLFTLSREEEREAERKGDISVVPLATPIIAGPGAMGGVILVASRAQGDPVTLTVIIVAVLAIMLVTLVLLLTAAQIRRYVSDTAVNVLTRVMGIILSALAMQFLFNGIIESGVFGATR